MPPTSVPFSPGSAPGSHHRVRLRGREVQSFRADAGGGELDRCRKTPATGKSFGSFSHYDGLALILVGIAIIAVSLVRFIRTTRLIDDQQSHSAASVRAELVLSVVLALIVAT